MNHTGKKQNKLYFVKEFDSDDEEVKLVKKKHIDWEKRFKKSIAMEYLPQSAVEPSSTFDSPLKTNSGLFRSGTFEVVQAEQSTNEVETQIYKKKLLDQRKSEVDQKCQEMNEKILFFEDIIDIDKLITHEVHKELTKNSSPTQQSTSYLHSWNFSTLDLSKLDKVCVVRDIFLEMEWFRKFDIKEQVFIRFMWEVAYYYTRNSNPFHNFAHAVNVAHAGYYLINRYQKFASVMNEVQQFGFVVACLGHDLDHRGMTNIYEIALQTDIALTYHDNSPLEQHHAAVLFKILSAKGLNIMGSIKGETWRALKKEIVECILSTDMKSHFSMLTKFKQQVTSNSNFGVDVANDADRDLILGNFIHFADLSGSFKEFSTSNRWSKLVNMEFSRQVDSSEAVRDGAGAGPATDGSLQRPGQGEALRRERDELPQVHRHASLRAVEHLHGGEDAGRESLHQPQLLGVRKDAAGLQSARLAADGESYNFNLTNYFRLCFLSLIHSVIYE